MSQIVDRIKGIVGHHRNPAIYLPLRFLDSSHYSDEDTQFLDSTHYSEEEVTIKEIALACEDLGHRMALMIKDNPQLTSGLWDLVRAKDCFVRAKLIEKEEL